MDIRFEMLKKVLRLIRAYCNHLDQVIAHPCVEQKVGWDVKVYYSTETGQAN